MTSPAEERAARKAAREEAIASAKAAKAELLEVLEDKFETEIGQRGVAWDWLDTDVGIFAVKLGAAIHYTKFQAVATKAEKKATAIELYAYQEFILPNLIHPEVEEYKKITQVRAGIPDALAAVLIGLYQGGRVAASGK